MFNAELENTFQTFSLTHAIPVAIIFSIIGLIIYNRVSIRESRHFDTLRVGLAVMTLGQELALNIYRISFGEWSISTSLPLQLCGIAVLTTSYVLITKNETLFIRVFFIMMIGATMALITPGIEQNLGFPHFRFFQFFISHGLIVINFTFILFVMNYQKSIRYVHLLHNFISLIIIAAILAVVNILVDGNYMYLIAKPGEGTAFDLFGKHPWYLVNILLFGIPVLFHVFYLPFFVRDKLKNGKALA